MININVSKHPLVAHYLTRLRDNKTDIVSFKSCLERISYLMAAEVYSELKTENKTIFTPLKKAKGQKINTKVVILPILRAGLGLTEGFRNLYPNASISHIGLYRDEESLKPIKYYFKFPHIKDKKNLKVIVLDPMIATGGSIIFTIEYLLNMNIIDINIVSLLCAPEGLAAIEKRFGSSDKKLIKIFTCFIDDKLNDKGYILPGLGDAGDRLFGT
ncbi:MAG TPA: uracil phosphoribosyltransferase [Ignavibacteria bacterium]